MSFTVTEWSLGGLPAKVEGVCCGTLENPRLSSSMMVMLKCSKCGKVFRNPRINFFKIRGNPELDATARQ